VQAQATLTGMGTHKTRQVAWQKGTSTASARCVLRVIHAHKLTLEQQGQGDNGWNHKPHCGMSDMHIASKSGPSPQLILVLVGFASYSFGNYACTSFGGVIGSQATLWAAKDAMCVEAGAADWQSSAQAATTLGFSSDDFINAVMLNQWCLPCPLSPATVWVQVYINEEGARMVCLRNPWGKLHIDDSAVADLREYAQSTGQDGRFELQWDKFLW